MFSKKFKKRQPIAVKFFESAISLNKLHHAYIFTGSDSLEQYYLAIQIAKILNCEKSSVFDKNSENCKCINCSWINKNRHPAVITISPIDYTYGNKDSKSSTVISVAQAGYLKNALATSSPYKRVVIFTDAVEGKEYERKAALLWGDYKDILTPPASTEKDSADTERLNWISMPIQHETFNSATTNSLLKTVEEPVPNVTFFFLTRDKEDIMDTIISRCQTIPVLSKNFHLTDFDALNSLFDYIPPKNYNDAIFLAEKLMEISKQESFSLEELLNYLQNYLYKIIRTNYDNKIHITKLINFIEKIETAKLELANYVNPQAALDSLFLP